jgi:hypothetical protein
LAQPNLADWQGKDLIDSSGEKIGKLQDVYVDVETDEPMFGTVKEGISAATSLRPAPRRDDRARLPTGRRLG